MKAWTFFSVLVVFLPATQMPKRIHHSSCGRLIRFGKLVGSTAADVIFNFAPHSLDNRVEKNPELETPAFVVLNGLHLNLGVRTQLLNHVLGDEDLPTTVDPMTEFADEQPQRG